MKKTLLSLLAISMIAVFSNNLMAQDTKATENTNAGAVLIQAMTLTKSVDLHFGSNVLTTAAGGTVVLPSNSTTRTYTGGVATSPATPVATNAAFDVTGTGLETYSITLPVTTTVTHTSVATGVFTMDITLMKAYVASAIGEAVTGTLSAAGTDSFTLGGTLTVKAAQVGGIYAGTFNVTVDYN